MPAEKLRYAVGCIIAEEDETPDPQVLKIFTDKDFKVITIPAAQTVFHTRFPFRGTLSVVIAIRRVYAVVGQYAQVTQQMPYVHFYRY